MITAESRKSWNWTCLKSGLKYLKKLYKMLWSTETQEQIRNIVIYIYQSGKCYKAIFKALVLQWAMVLWIILHCWLRCWIVAFGFLHSRRRRKLCFYWHASKMRGSFERNLLQLTQIALRNRDRTYSVPIFVNNSGHIFSQRWILNGTCNLIVYICSKPSGV